MNNAKVWLFLSIVFATLAVVNFIQIAVAIFVTFTITEILQGTFVLACMGLVWYVLSSDQTKPLVNTKRFDGSAMFPLDKDWDSTNPTVQKWITGKPNPNARKRTPGEPPVW